MSKHGIQISKGDLLDDKYRVLSHIATGGMTEVYLAEELAAPERRWALKVANRTNRLSAKLVDEMKLLSELDHVNLPRAVDFFTTEDYLFLVQEYVDAVPLSDTFSLYNHKLSIESVLDIGIQLCDVLRYLHVQKPAPIIYRDLKPGNIMVGQDGNVKLIDFGIARRYQEDSLKDTVQVGTVGFAAPEQFERKQSDTRTDLFSLGALLYYLMSEGKYVYVAQKPIRFFNRRIPKSLDRCITELVKLHPDDRLQDAREAKVLLLKAKEERERRQGARWNIPLLRNFL